MRRLLKIVNCFLHALNTVKPCHNGPASYGIPPIIETIIWFRFISCNGNNRNLLITDRKNKLRWNPLRQELTVFSCRAIEFPTGGDKTTRLVFVQTNLSIKYFQVGLKLEIHPARDILCVTRWKKIGEDFEKKGPTSVNVNGQYPVWYFKKEEINETKKKCFSTI